MIRGDQRPISAPRDIRGTEIKIGSRCAFNRSGDVVVGEVVALTYGKRFPAKIAHDPEVRYGRGVSTVKRPGSVLVLRDGEN